MTRACEETKYFKILYTVSSYLLHENTEENYEIICREVCKAFDIYGCSIWIKGVNGQQRLGYYEKDVNIDNLVLSNLDFEISKYILDQNTPVIIDDLKKDRRFSGLKSIPLSITGRPIIHNNSVNGSITLYHHHPNNDFLEVLEGIAGELAYGVEQFKYNFSAKRQKKLRKELDIARNIQQSLLPKQIPKVPGITLGARNIPTYEVGGDYYDFIITDQNNLGIAIGDVMGKGVPAALFMAIARTVTRSLAKHDLAPNVVLSEINCSLFPDLSTQGMFLTMCYILYNPLQKALLYASAGHNPPLILEGNSGKMGLLKSKGIFIGGRPKLSYALQTKKLGTGDIVLFYTDGLVEAKNSSGEQFGIERAAEVLKEYRYCEVPALLDCISMRVMQFIGGREQSDDITFVVLKAE